MGGQLWEPCPRCHAEPVCSECGYCEKHCRCATLVSDRQQAKQFEAAYPGFLSQVLRHEEDGAQER